MKINQDYCSFPLNSSFMNRLQLYNLNCDCCIKVRVDLNRDNRVEIQSKFLCKICDFLYAIRLFRNRTHGIYSREPCNRSSFPMQSHLLLTGNAGNVILMHKTSSIFHTVKHPTHLQSSRRAVRVVAKWLPLASAAVDKSGVGVRRERRAPLPALCSDLKSERRCWPGGLRDFGAGMTESLDWDGGQHKSVSDLDEMFVETLQRSWLLDRAERRSKQPSDNEKKTHRASFHRNAGRLYTCMYTTVYKSATRQKTHRSE